MRTNLKKSPFIVLRWLALLIPLIFSLILIVNHLMCVISNGSMCWNGLSKDSRVFIYSFAFYFYIFYFILLTLMRKPIKRLIFTYIITLLFPLIIFGSAYLGEKRSGAPELRGIGMIGAYITVAGPGISLDAFFGNVFSRPYVKSRSVKDLMSSYIGREIYVLGGEARYQGNSIIIPVLISGDYLRAVKVIPKSTHVFEQMTPLFTIGPYSYNDRSKLEADYERKLIERGIIGPAEWSISEWNPQIQLVIRAHGRFAGAHIIRKDGKATALLALIQENSGRRSRDLWLFDHKNTTMPLNLTAFRGSLERNINSFEVSRDAQWIYLMGLISLPTSSSYAEPLFTRVTPSGHRDDIFEMKWKAFLDSNGFSRATADATLDLSNGCLIVAFSLNREVPYRVTGLRLAQQCGNDGFKLLGHGYFQIPYGDPRVRGVKALRMYELPHDNILIKLEGGAVVKLDLQHEEVDQSFQKNMSQALGLSSVSEGASPIKYDWGNIRFGTVTPQSWLIFYGANEKPQIIVTNADGIKLVGGDNF